MKWKCKCCGKEFLAESEEEFEYCVEEEVWGHLQMRHEDVFDEVQNWETPDMLEECYDFTEEE